MRERAVGLVTGCSIGFIGGITTDRIIEVAVLAFLGGLLGGAGQTLWKALCKIRQYKKEIKKRNEVT